VSAPLEILYQDEWLVAVDKPAGQLVHPADHPQEGDEVTMKILRDQIGARVYNVHRIDRPTTGVLLFSICQDAARALHRALERHEMRKTYRAVVLGHVEAEEWSCREPLQKEASAPFREAHTSFRKLATITHAIGTLSLLEAIPHTGRFHQIRKHLLHAGIPIVGDYRYAGIETSNTAGEILGTGTRMLLQSRRLEFVHPVTGSNVQIEAPDDSSFLKVFPA